MGENKKLKFKTGVFDCDPSDFDSLEKEVAGLEVAGVTFGKPRMSMNKFGDYWWTLEVTIPENADETKQAESIRKVLVGKTCTPTWMLLKGPDPDEDEEGSD
uniref:Uncharacterized protein n=1 Tax=Chromera velia CCMP2878 TaxID=1169474 RepID=A0A0K6SA15_9ALVE|eukprot:Cvel_31215.t1-p1 / transcript=Cvel_31215.t1 / gene=Cvel_31215 / organism=Chromera_velia_CCMP2878 / gene_product=hypothetical protein / transcript_product=hypothetical protein / location=Cvel_scaffold4610:3452-3754(-) / protein_length=101 / sequence_SO=supercontig / SO=protein_coding / is_pseudo=false